MENQIKESTKTTSRFTNEEMLEILAPVLAKRGTATNWGHENPKDIWEDVASVLGERLTQIERSDCHSVGEIDRRVYNSNFLKPSQFEAVWEISNDDKIEINSAFPKSIITQIDSGDLFRDGELLKFYASLLDFRKHVKLKHLKSRAVVQISFWRTMNTLVKVLLNSMYGMVGRGEISVFSKKETGAYLKKHYIDTIGLCEHLILYMDVDRIVCKSGRKHEVAEILESRGYLIDTNPE
jgi:hypothetical protein